MWTPEDPFCRMQALPSSMDMLSGQDGLPDAIAVNSEKNSTGLFRAFIGNIKESDESVDLLDEHTNTGQRNPYRHSQVTAWEGTDDISGKMQKEQESSLVRTVYSITTESDIDTTSVLLPSGGIQSHPHAKRKAIIETQSLQHVKYDSLPLFDEVKCDQSQLNLCPKIKFRNKKSTVPFSFGIQSQALCTIDALDEEKKSVHVDKVKYPFSMETFSIAPPRDVPHHHPLQANSELKIDVDQSTGITESKCELSYLVKDNHFEETSSAPDFCKLKSLSEINEPSELWSISQSIQNSHKTGDCVIDPVDEKSKYSTINEKQMNQEVLAESIQFDKLVNEKFEEEGENISLPATRIDSLPPSTKSDISQSLQCADMDSLDLDDTCFHRQVDKNKPCISSMQIDTEKILKLDLSEPSIEMHKWNQTAVGNFARVEGPELTTKQFNTMYLPVEDQIQEPFNPQIQKLAHTHEDLQQLIKAFTQTNNHISEELILGKEFQEGVGKSSQVHTLDQITVDKVLSLDDPENIQVPMVGQPVNQTIIYQSNFLDGQEPFNPLLQKFDDTTDSPVVNEKWQEPCKISTQKVDHATEDLHCNMERQYILDQTAEIQLHRFDDLEFQVSKQIFSLDDKAEHQALELVCHAALVGTLSGNYEVDFESTEEISIKNIGEQDSLNTNTGVESGVTFSTEQKDKACSTCEKADFNLDRARIDMEPTEMEDQSPNNEDLGSTESGEKSEWIHDQEGSLHCTNLLPIAFPPSSENTTDLKFPVTNETQEVVVKTSVSDLYGNMIKECSDSFLQELRRIFLDANGHGFNLLDSGIVLSKKKDIKGGYAIITLRNGTELGMKVSESNLFLYYQYGIHFYTTKELSESWFYVKDRITQEEMIMKKIPITINWVKMLHNFLFLPYYSEHLVPYAVIYDRNGFIQFLMQHRHVLAVGIPPPTSDVKKSDLVWSILRYLKYCKKHGLFPVNIEQNILHTTQGVFFDPSSLCNVEDSCTFKKAVRAIFNLLPCTEQQEHCDMEILTICQHLLEETAWLSESWLADSSSSSYTGPVPFSFPR